MAQQYRQGFRVMKNLYRGVELLSRNQTSAFLGRENHLGHKNVLWRSTRNFLHPLANYEGYSRNYARAWEICCPNMWPHKPKSKSHRYQKSFVYLRRREETLRTSVYWPCIISVHQESWLQRWTLLRTVLWIGKIKGIIRVRCVETSMLHLHVSIKGVTKISPPPLPHHHHYHGDEGWGQRRSCSLNDLQLCQTSGKSLYFHWQEELIQTSVQRYSHPSP